MSEYAGGQYPGGPTWPADAADWRIRDATIRDHLADECTCDVTVNLYGHETSCPLYESAHSPTRACVSCGCTDDRGCGEDGCAWATLNPPLCTTCIPALVGPFPALVDAQPPDPEPETTDLEVDDVSPAGIALGRYVIGPMIAGAAFGLGLIGIYGLIDLVHAWLG